MQEAEAKVGFLAEYADTVAEVATALGSGHTARVYSRALLLAADSFLVFAPNVKNRAARAGTLTAAEVTAVEQQLHQLRQDYGGHFDNVRDRVTAHQQELPLERLIRVWNDVDASTVHILRDDMMDVSRTFERHGVLTIAARSATLEEPRVRKALAAIETPRGVRIGNDRLAVTRGEVGLIAARPTQEKAQRILTGFEHIRLLSELPDEINDVLPAQKARWDLIVVDLLGLLDNLFTDDPGGSGRAPDPALLTLWTQRKFGGAATLASFERDVALEQQLRLIRNKASAHIDTQMLLREVVDLIKTVPALEVFRYVEAVYAMFMNACSEDVRTRFLLIHGRPLRSVYGVADTDATKPF